MSIIFSDDINDKQNDALNKRVDTVYDYIKYMKEQLEFWARNRTREISDADKKIADANARITDNADAIADLEPRIQAYENDIELGSTITVNKPTMFDDGIQPKDSDGVTGVEVLPARASDRLGGRIKLDRGESTARDAYIDTFESKLRFIDRNPSTAVRASLDLADGYFDAGGYKINGTNVADFPVEYGTSNGWRYRKWNSGWFEAWHDRIGADIPANQSMMLFTVNFPFTLPSVASLYSITFGSYQNTSSVSNASIFDVSTWTTTQLSIRAFRNYTETAGWGVSPRCCIQIQGSWK